MKADWEALGDEYASSSSVLIGDVDCTVETALCSEMGVSGYPTIKYWKDGKANDYQSGRDAVSLKKVVVFISGVFFCLFSLIYYFAPNCIFPH